MAEPHVSCLMATGDRPHFMRQAVRCFLAQTRTDAELIVVDGGLQPIEELCAGYASIRYFRVPPETSLGMRMNIAAEHARGSILQKLDDDDYYHPRFLERAVPALEGDPRPDAIAAWDCFSILLAGDPALRFSRHGWAAGGTLCFRRALWERTPFRDIPASVDHFFLHDHGAVVARVCAPELYLMVRHGANTWRRLDSADVDEHFRSLPAAGLTIADIVQPEERGFYVRLAGG